MRENKAKIRAVTGIDKDSIGDCKKLINQDMIDANDLRHLNGIKCGIAVSENQFISTAYSLLRQMQNNNKDVWANDAIYSQKEEIIQHNN